MEQNEIVGGHTSSRRDVYVATVALIIGILLGMFLSNFSGIQGQSQFLDDDFAPDDRVNIDDGTARPDFRAIFLHEFQHLFGGLAVPVK